MIETKDFVATKPISFFLKIFFWAVFFINAACLYLHSFEIFNLLDLGKAEASRRYPFGTEQGFNYHSYETYLAVEILFAAVFLQALLVSCFLHLRKLSIPSLAASSGGLLTYFILYSLGLLKVPG